MPQTEIHHTEGPEKDVLNSNRFKMSFVLIIRLWEFVM